MADATLPVAEALTMVTCLTRGQDGQILQLGIQPVTLVRPARLIGNQHLTGGRKLRTVTQRSDP
jgi:hypothetical protein